MSASSRKRRIAEFVLPSVAGLAVAQYWILSLARGESLSVAATYRYGDYNYFPPLASLAHLNFGEWLVLERLGEGIQSFPFPPLVFHALGIGLLGPAGFVVADVVVAVCVYLAARRLFRACGLFWPTSEILTLVVACGLLSWPGAHLHSWLGWHPHIHLWGFRFPRPFVTHLFLLLCLGSWLRVFVQRSERTRDWIGLGVFFGLLLQSRFYSATTVGLAIAVAAVQRLVREEDGRMRTLRGCVYLVATTALTLLPYVVQRLLEHPDAPVRFGAFPVERLRPLMMRLGFLQDIFVATAFAALSLALVRRSGLPERRVRMGSVVGLALMCLLSALALPVSTVLLGRTIQPYQFGDELQVFKTLVMVVALGQLLDRAATTLSGQLPPGSPLRSGSRAALIAIVALSCLVVTSRIHRPWVHRQVHMRTDIPAYRPSGYREAFRDLTRELASERYEGNKVLATLDIQVLDWWSLFGGGHAFAPDPCATTVSDDEIEGRLLTLFRILGATGADALRLLNDRAVLMFFLGCAKYQASQAHSFAPLEDYALPGRREIVRSSPSKSWRLALPISEQRRLLGRYLRTGASLDGRQLDLVVLGPRGPLYRGLAPSPDRFELTFENDLFRVYQRKGHRRPELTS